MCKEHWKNRQLFSLIRSGFFAVSRLSNTQPDKPLPVEQANGVGHRDHLYPAHNSLCRGSSRPEFLSRGCDHSNPSSRPIVSVDRPTVSTTAPAEKRRWHQKAKALLMAAQSGSKHNQGQKALFSNIRNNCSLTPIPHDPNTTSGAVYFVIS